MTQKRESDAQDGRSSSSSGRGDTGSLRRPPSTSSGRAAPVITEPPAAPPSLPRLERTLEVRGAAARVIARALDSTLDAGMALETGTPPTSSDRLATLAAHLPTVPRDAYAVGAQVAKGGIGRVMLARDQRLDRPVAIKELLVWNEAQEQRFVREALLTARLQHPAIVPLYEAGRWPDGEPFYAMKLVSGRTLSELISEGKTLADRLSLLPHVLAAAQAIAYAHTQRVLHRDLKPANVLVGEFGETVVIDWGLAKGLAEDDGPKRNGAMGGSVYRGPVMSAEGLTVDGAVVGTPAYMPPEQAAGEPVDERADVYAIGAMLYQLIAAVPPYHDVPWDRLLQTIASEPPRRIEEHAPAISDDLSAIVHKAMARSPADRYRNAKELADDLHRFQTGQIVGAHTYSSAQLLKRFWRRNRTALSIAASAVALITLVVIGAFVKTEGERRIALGRKIEAEEAQRAAESARKDAEAAGHQATTRADEMTLLQAQGAIHRDPNEAIAWLKTLSPSFSDAGELRRIAADAQARGISRSYRGHVGHINWVSVLDGGRRFATASDDKTVRIWEVATGQSRVLAGHTDEVWRVAAFPDSSRVVSISKDATARIWDTQTGTELARATLPALADRVQVRGDGAVVGWSQDHPGPPWIWAPGAAAVRLVSDTVEDVRATTVNRDSTKAIVELKDGTVYRVDIDSGKRHAMPGVPAVLGHWWQLSDDGRTALFLGKGDAESHPYELRDIDSGARRAFTVAGRWQNLFLTHRGDTLISVGPEQVELLDARTGALKRRFPGHASAVYVTVLSDDDQGMITGGFDRTVRTWSFATGETRSYSGLGGAGSALAFWPDHRSVIAASSAGDLRLFEPGRSGTILTDHGATATGLAVSAGGRIASADDKGALRIVDLEGKLIAEHKLAPSPNMRLRPSPDQKHFAGAGVDPKVFAKGFFKEVVHEPGTLLLGTFDGERPMAITLPGQIRDLLWHPGGDSVFAALTDGTVQRVTLDGTVAEVDRMSGQAAALAVSADGAWLAAGSTAGAVRVTDLASQAHSELGRHKDQVHTLAFSPAGLLATGCVDHTFRLWRLDDGTFRSFDASGGGVIKLEFSADAKTLFVINDSESLLRRWSVESGAELAPFTGHSAPIRGFQLSADGRRILTRALDTSVRVVDAATGKSRALLGHRLWVSGAAFAADGKVIVTLGNEGTVRAWPDDLPETLPELRTWLETATPDTVEKR